MLATKRSTKARVFAGVCALALAALVAAGCGGSSSSGAGSAATDSAGLDYVSEDAVLYAVFDTDFGGDTWKTAKKHLSNFDAYDDAQKELLDSFERGSKDDPNDVKWSEVDPWLGDQVGVALNSVKYDEDSSGADDESEAQDILIWATLEDGDKALDFLKSESKSKKSGSYEGYDLYVDGSEDEDDTFYFTIKDNLLVGAETKANLKGAIDTKKSGKNVTEADGLKDVAKEVGDDAVMGLVISGVGLQKLAKDASKENEQLDKAGKDALKQLEALEGVAFSVGANKDGFHAHGFAGIDADKLDEDLKMKDFEPTLAEGLPEGTILALSGMNVGGALQSAVETITKSDQTTAGQVAAIEGALGVTLDDLATAFAGQFALSVGSGGSAIPPINLLLETSDKAAATKAIDGIMNIAGQSQGSKPTDVQVAGEAGKQLNLGVASITAAVVDDIAIVTTDPDNAEAVVKGDGGLGKSDAFKEAADAADMPDKVTGLMWLDVQAALKYASLLGESPVSAKEGEALGPWLGWSAMDDDSATFDIQMMIEDTSDDK